MNRVSRPIGKWAVRTDRVTRFCSSLRAAERLMGDHLTNTGRPDQAAAGVIYDPEGKPVVGAVRDGLGWVAMDPVMVETMLLAFHGKQSNQQEGRATVNSLNNEARKPGTRRASLLRAGDQLVDYGEVVARIEPGPGFVVTIIHLVSGRSLRVGREERLRVARG